MSLNLVSAAGIAVLLGVAWLCSADRRRMNARVIGWGLALRLAFALCGFAHVASLGIFVGGTAALAPSRAADLAAVGFRALLAATLACLLTAAVAGTFLSGSSILLGE